MSLWEYKVITSGKGGFARPDLMEKFLNDLGRDEWEIIQFHTQPDNFLVFTGLARRSTQRDWTLEDAAAAAAKVEAEKLRAEFEAKFKAANQPASLAAEERAPSFIEEKAAPDDGFRKPVDTSHDDEPEAVEDEKDDWDKLTAAEEEELPTFFEAIKPHMRRNQRGPGMSVGVDYLAKKWDQNEDDLKGALAECGFVVPEDEDAKPEYLEYDGDLYWLNINRRGELWINTKEKPRPVFRPVKAQKIVVEEEPAKSRPPQQQPQPQSDVGEKPERFEKAENGERKPEGGERKENGDRKAETTEAGAEGAEAPAQPQRSKSQGGQGGGGPLPTGVALLDKIRPHMRRNRRGAGGSGSASFLSRALRTNEAELKTAFIALGLTMPGTPSDKPVYTEVGNDLWWLNLDSRGGLWINGREKKPGETAAGATEAGVEQAAEAPQTEGAPAEGAPGATATEVSPTSEAGGAVEGAAAGVPVEQAAEASSAPDSAPTAEPASDAETVSQTEPAPSAMTRSEAESASESAQTSGSRGDVETPIADASERAREVAPMAAAEPSGMPESSASAAAGESTPSDANANAGAAVSASPSGGGGLLAAVRPLLRETKTGANAAKTALLAEEAGKSVDDLIASLVSAGLKVPEKPRERPVLVEHAGEVFWLSKNARGELWLNAKAAKLAEKEGGEPEPGGEAADESTGDAAENTSEGGEGDAEKKPRRTGVRSRSRKPE